MESRNCGQDVGQGSTGTACQLMWAAARTFAAAPRRRSKFDCYSMHPDKAVNLLRVRAEYICSLIRTCRDRHRLSHAKDNNRGKLGNGAQAKAIPLFFHSNRKGRECQPRIKVAQAPTNIRSISMSRESAFSFNGPMIAYILARIRPSTRRPTRGSAHAYGKSRETW